MAKNEHPDTDLHRAGCTHCQYIYDSKLPDVCGESSKLRAALLAVLPNVPGWNTQDFAGRPWLVQAKEALR